MPTATCAPQSICWRTGAGAAQSQVSTLEIVELPGRTPVLFGEIAGTSPDAPTVLLYGHYDKQPEFTGWQRRSRTVDTGAPRRPSVRPRRRGRRLCGIREPHGHRGVAAAGSPLPRCVLLIEGCEESGSFDLPPYLDHLAPRIGTPDLVVCLDAECGDYEHLWLSTSLRGLLLGTLDVPVLTEGVHSGAASGIVPSSFRILRSLLDRIEDRDQRTHDRCAARADRSRKRAPNAQAVVDSLGDVITQRYPWQSGTTPMAQDLVELVLNNTWRPTLSVTGLSGAPPVTSAGNTLRPSTAAKLSIRLPPTLDGAPPNGQSKHCSNRIRRTARAFDSNPTARSRDGPHRRSAPALATAFASASETYFDQPVRYMGMGGTIPFLKMLGDRYPHAQFMVTGVLGPHSNAHGPNEFLDIETGKRVTACVAHVLAQRTAADALSGAWRLSAPNCAFRKSI